MSIWPTVLQEPQLRRLLGGQALADFADWLDYIAIAAVLAFGWQAGPMVFALLAAAMGLPYLLVGPLAGVMVDRVATRPVLIISNIGRAVATLAMVFAPGWQVLLVLVALRSGVDAFFTPAKQAAIQALAPKDSLMAANGASHAINQISKILAPALGGAAMIWLSPQNLFAINTGLSVLAALLMMQLAPIERRLTAGKQSIWADLGDATAFLRRRAILQVALAMMGVGYFAIFFYDTLLAPLTRDFGLSQVHLGAAIAASGAGGVAGALVLGLANITRPFRIVALVSWLSGLGVAALGWMQMSVIVPSPVLFVGLFVPLGFASGLALVSYRTIIQTEAGEDQIGRITALSEAVNTLALLTAPFLGAWLAQASSIGAAWICGGAIMLGVGVAAWRQRGYLLAFGGVRRL
ncbi:MAG: MFS transporter [Rhodobacteraceae bacterium]|nr:MFS transporter [Paracoccaceae bacterium]